MTDADATHDVNRIGMLKVLKFTLTLAADRSSGSAPAFCGVSPNKQTVRWKSRNYLRDGAPESYNIRIPNNSAATAPAL